MGQKTNDKATDKTVITGITTGCDDSRLYNEEVVPCLESKKEEEKN